MPHLRSRKRSITTTGAGASATGSCTFVFDTPVRLHAVLLDFDPLSGAGTEDVTIDNLGRTITLSSNSTTDTLVYPREQARDGSGAAISAWYAEPVLGGTATVSVAQGSAANPAVQVELFYYDF